MYKLVHSHLNVKQDQLSIGDRPKD